MGTPHTQQAHWRPANALQPNADAWEWQLRASCRDEEPALFFHPDGERGAQRRERHRAAKAICTQCPVRTACLDHSLRVPELFGTWGGVSEEERNHLLGRARHPRPKQVFALQVDYAAGMAGVGRHGTTI